MSNNILSNLYNQRDIFIILISVIVLYFVCLTIWKIYVYRSSRRIFYIFPSLDIKGISNISIFIAISVSLIFLLTIISAGVAGLLFRMYPGWRILIEGVLIKISGLVFGPIIGMFVGMLTDILTITMTAGMFHYGFFFICILYGFLSGIIRNIYNKNKHNLFLYICSITLIALLIMVFVCVNLYCLYDVYTITLFGTQISMRNIYLILYVASFILIILSIMWILAIFYHYYEFIYILERIKLFFSYYFVSSIYTFFLKKRINSQYYAAKQDDYFCKNFSYLDKKKNQIQILKNIKKSNFSSLVSVFGCIIVCEFLINIYVMPVFDKTLGGGMDLDYWIFIRTISLLPTVILNILIIFPVYIVILPFIKYDYTDNLYKKKLSY